MRIIYRIARMELACLFYSVVAWLVLILFTIHAGFIFTRYLTSFVIDQEAGFPLRELTSLIFLNTSPTTPGLLPAVQGMFYFYIPLLAMGLISRELSSGSIKLLQTSPVSNIQIVFGKFLSLMLYGLMLIFILVSLIIVGNYSITALDISQVISGLIGLYLLLCLYAAVGLFMSSLSAYQVIAAISALVSIAALNYIGQVGQKIYWLGDFTYQLRLNGRLDQFMNGLISSRNIFYFFLMTFLFLGLTVIRLNNMQSSKSLIRKTGIYIVFNAAILLMIYFSSFPFLTAYLDMTAGKTQTISKEMHAMLKKLDRPLILHTYVNTLGNYSYLASPELKNADKDFFEPYQRFRPDLALDYTYYYDSATDPYIYKNYPGLDLKGIAEKMAPFSGFDFNSLLSPVAVHKIFNTGAEGYQLVRILESGGHRTFLRVFQDVSVQPSETEVAAAVKRLLVTPPKIAFLSGHYERKIDRAGDKEYKELSNQPDYRQSLINQGFDVMSLSLEKEDVPDSLTALIIAAPKTSFSGNELTKINRYIQKGGNMLICAEPGTQGILNPLLDIFGIQLTGTLTQKNGDFPPEFIVSRFSRLAVKQFPDVRVFIEDGARITMPGTVGVRYKNSSDYYIDPFLIVDSSTVAVTATRQINGHQQHILVLGDADLLSHAELDRKSSEPSNNFYNRFLSRIIFKWFDDGRFPVTIPYWQGKDYSMRITESASLWISCFFLGILPGSILIFGAILLVRRKRR